MVFVKIIARASLQLMIFLLFICNTNHSSLNNDFFGSSLYAFSPQAFILLAHGELGS